MPPKPWKTLTSRLVYENPWTRVREDIAEMPNGKTTLYGVIELGHAVGVLPFLDDDRVVLVRQYRYVFGENHRWEIPTGGVKLNEPLEQAAQRELREETGYSAGLLEPISTFYSSKSVVYEIPYLFIGRDLTPGTPGGDDTEFMEVAVFPFAEVLDLVLRSEIRDAMTIIAVLLAAQRRNPSP